MNYGHFDLENKEYVITRPDTPSAWANYLGSPGTDAGRVCHKLCTTQSQSSIHSLSRGRGDRD